MNPALNELRAKYPTLSAEYFRFLEEAGGTEGELATDPGWYQVWSAEDALVASDEYCVPEFLPGFFAFGSSGGGELFVLALGQEEAAVFMVPAAGMSREDLLPVAENLVAFTRAMSPRT